MSLTEIRSEMSRRSTRMFVEEQEFVDRSNITMSASSRESSVDDNEKAAHQSKSKSTIAGGDISQQAMVNVGRSLDIFPITSEDINLHSKFSHLSRGFCLAIPAFHLPKAGTSTEVAVSIQLCLFQGTQLFYVYLC